MYDDVECDYCGKPGHRFNSCPMRDDERPELTVSDFKTRNREVGDYE